MTNTDAINARNEAAAVAHWQAYSAALKAGKTIAEAMALAEAARAAINAAGSAR